MEDIARGPLEAGCHYPLGANWDGGGVNFAVFSAHAERIELCLFDEQEAREVKRLALKECTDHVWHGYLPDARPGLLYGFRAHGPYRPERGQRFNHHKLLLDPYARGFGGTFHWSDVHYGYRAENGDLSFDERDNAAVALKSRVVDPAYDWGEDRPPRTPWADTVLYEAHVRGFSISNPAVPKEQRGRYGGLAAPASIAHLQRLGITAVELLPLHELIDERALVRNGLVNYWGYNSIGFFAPAARYAAGADPIAEFRAAVRRLHAAGIEVILDVVYNHTAESDELGPTLAFRGLDNESYYRLLEGDPRRYDNVSGCGNTLNLAHPRVLQMVMDSLRWWVDAMHVDGFRFDLATALARSREGFDPAATFLETLRQDPVLAGAKLIAEPWDHTGVHTGRFPAPFAEWNDRFRDTVRGFWLTREAGCGELARRLAASRELFHHGGRAPQSSINFVSAHDGFTLADLVSYERKHNEANRQGNADGPDYNHSIHCGIEGPSTDPGVLLRRAQLQRALLATLVVAAGVPMILAGDEQGRTQQGNNNAYCQDNALSWLDWENADRGLAAFAEAAVALRKQHSVLRRRRWLDGSFTPLAERDVTWLWVDGTEMSRERWEDPENRCLAVQLGRDGPMEAAILVLINGGSAEAAFELPPAPAGAWTLALASTEPGALAPGGGAHDLVSATVPARSLIVLASSSPAAQEGAGQAAQ